MASVVELRPGDTLNIVWSSVQETPLGDTAVESSFAFTYEELLVRLRKGRLGKSKRSGTAGARFSRFVALSTNAMKKGKWSTGADIDRDQVFEKLILRLSALDPAEYANLTSKAKRSLQGLFNSKILRANQKTQLKGVIAPMGIEV